MQRCWCWHILFASFSNEWIWFVKGFVYHSVGFFFVVLCLHRVSFTGRYHHHHLVHISCVCDCAPRGVDEREGKGMQSFKLMYSYGNFVLMCIKVKVMMSFVSAANGNSKYSHFPLICISHLQTTQIKKKRLQNRRIKLRRWHTDDKWNELTATRTFFHQLVRELKNTWLFVHRNWRLM